MRVTVQELDAILTDRKPRVKAYGFYPSLGEWIAVDTTTDVAFANHMESEQDCVDWLARHDELKEADTTLMMALVSAHFAEMDRLGMCDKDQERRILYAIGGLPCRTD